MDMRFVLVRVAVVVVLQVAEVGQNCMHLFVRAVRQKSERYKVRGMIAG